MSKNKILHYKKVFNEYGLIEHEDHMDIDYYANRMRYGHRSLKIPKYGFWGVGSSLKTKINEETYLKNYGNRLISLNSESFTIVIEEYDNKISLKTYCTEKLRSVGSPYFKIRRWMKYCTYNLKTKNFYFGEVTRKNKQLISKKVRSNKFDIDFLNSLRLYIRRKVRDLSNGDNIENASISTMMSEEIIKVFFNILTHKTSIQIDYNMNNLDAELFKLYLEHNGFKYPDNYSEYSRIFLPKKKLRKNNNVVSLVMSEMKVGGSRIKKIFNQHRDIDFSLIFQLYTLLGVDYFNQLNDDIFINGVDDNYKGPIHLDFINSNNPLFNLKGKIKNHDKKRILNLLNQKLRYSLIVDHLKMIEKLKNEYNHDFKMRCNDRHSFDHEHYELSELLSSYKKGDITRSYGDHFKERIEESIMGMEGVDYYPVLLTNSKEYNEESFVQSNCVRTYIEKPSCLIISLREGSEGSEERITIEYQFRRNEILRVQTLGKYNKNISPRYNAPIEELDHRIKELYRKNILHIPIMVKEFKTGKKIKRKAFFEGMENHGPLLNVTPVWDNNQDCSEDFFDLDLFF